MLALAVNDPAFGILYVGAIAVLTAALVFRSAIAPRPMYVLQLAAVLLLGFFIGTAVTGAYRDVSGTQPVTIARTSDVAAVATGPVAVPKAGPPAGEISVDVFQPDAGERRPATERITVKSGDGIRVEGWAFDVTGHAPCGAVDVAVDGKSFDRVKYGLPRPDVAGFYHDPAHAATGFGGVISTKGLRPGDHRLQVRCIELSTNVAHPGTQPHELTVTK